MIMAKDSNNNYVKIEDIKQQNNFFNGISPIKFKGSGENLENYRIYGNTVGGESVGDRTENLFDENSEPIPGFLNDGGAIATVPNYPISTYDYINVLPNTNYSYKAFIDAGPNSSTHKTIRVSYYTNSKVFISRYFEIDKGLTKKTITTPNNCFYVRLSIDDNLRNVMLWRGSSDVSVYEPCGYRVPVMVTNGMDAQTTNIYLPEQIKMVGDEAEYVDYQEQKMHRVRKNLLKNTATSQTINGLTYTVNTDGSVTCNGRREQTSQFFKIGSVTTSGEIILSGCPSGGSSASFAMRAFSATVSNPRDYYDIGDGCMLNIPDTYNIYIRIQSDYTCDNLTFYPMIRKADIEDDTYEPYIENTELDVTLPALPALSGTNTLSVETNTKPSKVWGKLSDPRDILYVKDNLGNILFSKYHEIEGEPPLIYKAKKAGTLTDYRIYGAEGNVGNLRPSLVAATDFTNGYHVATDGTIGEHGKRVATLTPIDVSAINTIYVNSGINTLSNPVIIYSLFSDDTFIERALVNGIETVINTEGANKLYLSFGGESKVTTANLNNVYVMDNDKMYVIPVTVSGKNKFDGTLISGYYIDSTMTSIGAASGNYKSFKLLLSAGTYTFSCNIPVLIVRYITADSYISNPTSGRITQTHTFTVSDDGYVSLAFRNAENIPWDDSTMIQIEEAQTATEYEPYHDPINTNIYLPEQIKMVGDKAEYADYQEQKLHRVRKNLLQNTASSQTKNGVTFTVNNDGSVTCNGTASNNTFFKIGDFSLASQSYILTGCPSDGGNDSYTLRCYKNGNIKGADVGNGFNINESIDGYIEIRIASGYTCNNLIFYPMIRKADITDDTYESYITNTELDVTLSALPTLSGTNTLTVGTEVQPSKVYLKGKIEEIPTRTVSYYSQDGSTLLGTETVESGGNASGLQDTPTKPDTEQYTYTFVGWSNTTNATTAMSGILNNITVDKSVYAAFSETEKTFTVTFYNGAELIYTAQNVSYNGTAVYSGTTPTKAETSEYTYTFAGWNTNSSASTADADALTNVTADRTVYAIFTAASKGYTVYFYNGETLLETVTGVPSGGTATYTGATPTKSGYVFTGWSPSPTNIQADTACYAQFKEDEMYESITDTWSQIIANVSNGTYSTKYQVGDTKKIDLGTEGEVIMAIVGIDTDDLADNSGKAPITWISKQLLKTSHRMNSPKQSGTSGTGTLGGWEACEMRRYLINIIKPLLPSEVRNALKTVKKYSKIYNTSDETAVNNVVSNDDIWIPSAYEMNFTGYETSGVTYSTAFPDKASRIKHKVGDSAERWWLRSADSTGTFRVVGSVGGCNFGGASYPDGVAVGFCT